MNKHKLFHNPHPRISGETVEIREAFDRVAADVKDRCAERGNFITDDEAIEGARNLIGYVELLRKITARNLMEGKIPQEEIEAAKKRGIEMGWLDSEGRAIKQKKPGNIKVPEPQS